MIAASTLLAHQGGWDEVLLVLLPIGLFAALLGYANKRAGHAWDDDGDEADTEDADLGDDAATPPE